MLAIVVGLIIGIGIGYLLYLLGSFIFELLDFKGIGRATLDRKENITREGFRKIQPSSLLKVIYLCKYRKNGMKS